MRRDDSIAAALAFSAMPSRDYHEALWRSIPAGLPPAAHALRSAFLREHVVPGKRVLDVGCGEGFFAAELAAAGALVLGIDVAEEPLRRARARHPELDLRLIDGDGPWPLEDSAFDVIWAGEVIEHVADTAAWLSELRRVLRSGGSLLLSAPAHGRAALLAAAISPRVFAAHFDPRGEHLRFYNRASLSRLLADFGFESVSLRSAGGHPGARALLLAHAVRSRF
jgi:2-polyprenyl-3-methyl-5-hydroxy-6-metoxy-1,4-benzoquinol methylase